MPGSLLRGLEGYLCPFWLIEKDKGSFDISGYEIDHVIEYAISENDNLDNLQALCINCHRVKTIRFNRDKNSILREGKLKLVNKNIGNIKNDNKKVVIEIIDSDSDDDFIVADNYVSYDSSLDEIDEKEVDCDKLYVSRLRSGKVYK